MATDTQIKYERQRKYELHNKLRRNRSTIGWLSSIGILLSVGFISPPNTFVQCNDPYINFEMQADSISIVTLLLISLLGPFFIMSCFEWLDNYDSKIASSFVKALKKAYDYFSSLFVGNLFSFFIVEMLKTTVSEPRPHFLKTCKPNFTDEQCNQPWIHVGVENCTNPYELSPYRLIDAMKSFPSGHASIAVFSVLFISVYVQKRVKIKWSNVLVPWMHMVCWTWASLCCASRVWDNRHHWWDVMAGAAIGAIAAYATVKYLCNDFKDKCERTTFDTSDEDTTSNDLESLKQKNTQRI